MDAYASRTIALARQNLVRNIKTYMRERNYSLHTVEDYTKLLEEAGFKNVCGEDRKDIFIQTLKHELKNLEKSTLLKQEKNNLHKIWQEKKSNVLNVEKQGWGWFSGEKVTMTENMNKKVEALTFWQQSILCEPVKGGITNLNFRVEDGNDFFFVRLGEDIPEHGIYRFNELAASRAAFV